MCIVCVGDSVRVLCVCVSVHVVDFASWRERACVHRWVCCAIYERIFVCSCMLAGAERVHVRVCIRA